MMRRVSEMADRARVLGRAAGLFGVTALSLAAYEGAGAIFSKERQAAHLIERRDAWLKAVISILGLDIHSVGAAHATPPPRARLVVANHRSALDIAVVMKLFPGHFLSRGDIAGWPVLGRAAKQVGTIFVDRAAGQSRAQAVRMIRSLLENQVNVMVFPEGTTHAGDEVREFHAGSFLALRDLDAEVVPVGLAYEPGVEYIEPTFTAHLDKVARRPRTRVVASVGQAIDSKTPPRELAKVAREQVQNLVHEARAELVKRS